MYVYLAIALVAAAVSGFSAWEVQGWRFAAHEKERIQQEQKDALHRAEKVDVAAVAHEKDKVQIETKYVVVTEEVEHEVEKPVYRNVCVGPDGLRILSDLVERTDPGKPAGAVPEAHKPP